MPPITPVTTPINAPIKKQKTEQTPPKIQHTNSASGFKTPDTKPQASTESYTTPINQGITTPTEGLNTPPAIHRTDNSVINFPPVFSSNLAVPNFSNNIPASRLSQRPNNNNNIPDNNG
jgi:hypothetical protein